MNKTEKSSTDMNKTDIIKSKTVNHNRKKHAVATSRKLFSLIVSVLLVLSMLAACSKPAENTESNPKTGEVSGTTGEGTNPAGGHSGTTGGETDPASDSGVVTVADKSKITLNSYEELYSKISQKRVSDFINRGFFGFFTGLSKDDAMINDVVYEEVEVSAAASEGSSDLSPAPTDYASTDFSDTNVQVDGVMEGDIIKTDGSYIYVLNRNARKFTVLKIVYDGKTEKVTEFYFENTLSGVEEMYLSSEAKKLVFVGTVYNYESGEKTVVLSYDVSNPANITLISRLTQDGYYQSSRMSDGYLYVFSNEWKGSLYYANDNMFEKDKPETYIPSVNNEVLPIECIYIPSEIEELNYTVITSVDLNNPNAFCDTKSILGSNTDYYVSGGSIYLLSWEYDYTYWTIRQTTIHRLAYEKGMINHVATGTFEGCIKDQFAMDEHNGYFRVCATVYNSQNYYNAVYVLDGDLKLVGTLSNIAPNERIYSARYFGDIVYFVTYRETDPLFSVDLSDPTNPKMLGELHLPGYSEYLHPYGDNRLLGFGIESVFDESKGYNVNYLKLSMFDITDPANLKELHTLRLGNYSNSELLYNHRALIANAAKNIICFPASSYDYDGEIESSTSSYLVYTYSDASGFELKLESGFQNFWKYEYYYYEDWDIEYEDEPIVWEDDYNPYVELTGDEFDFYGIDDSEFDYWEYDDSEYEEAEEEESQTTEGYNPYAGYDEYEEQVEYRNEYSTDGGYVRDMQVSDIASGYYAFADATMRGIYVNDVLYVINLDGNVKCYRLSDFERISNDDF